MSRDSNGLYTLPLPSVISGEVVQASWANTTLDDVANSLTNSLDRQGRGGMLAPFAFADGNVGAPGATFSNETNSGLWRAGAGDVRMTIQGADLARWEGGAYQVWTGAAWAEVAVIGGSGTVPDGTIEEEGLLWDNAGQVWLAGFTKAINVSYDAGISGLAAANVKDAIDELAAADQVLITAIDNNTTLIGDNATAIGVNTAAINQLDIDKLGTGATAADSALVGGIAIAVLSQAEYDGLTPDPDTLYFINT